MAKRAFDVFFSLLGLIFLWPAFVIVGLLIVLDDKGPIFFRQERVGRFGKIFRIWKFRTMTVQNSGPKITVGEDRRITKVGQNLRKYKLDELPQLINVLVGEMSFVGPRPEVEKYVKLYTSEQRKVLNVKPGITDYASMKYSNESNLLSEAEDPEEFYINTVMPDKIKINLESMQKGGFLGDFSVILLTLKKIFSK